MKLYATVTSERASKGQGGNEYVDIDLQGEGGVLLARFVFMVNEDETSGKKYLLVRDESVGTGNIEVRTKGNEQKTNDMYGCIFDHEHGNGSKCEYHSI